MSKKKLLFISLLSGVLMALSWINVMSLGFLMLIAFIPLLFVEDYIANNSQNKRFLSTAVFIYSFPAFFIFTFANTWWISNASFIGYVVPVAEAAFMSIVFQVYSYSKKVAKQKTGAYFFLIFYWVAFEYVQFTWDINFPWLNLGNSFAQYPVLVQWYSVLGMESGTLWILLTNILLYLLIITTYQNKIKKESDKHKKDFILFKKEFTRASSYENADSHLQNRQQSFLSKWKYWIFVILILGIPICWSLVLWINYEDNYSKTAKVLIVQPNLDPYNEQYLLSPSQVIERVEGIATPFLDKNTDYLVLPESCIQEYAWEHLLDSVPSILELKNFTQNTELCEVIAGLSSGKLLPDGLKTPSARKLNNSDGHYYESCNTALMFNKLSSQEDMQVRHKSVLVVGVEKMPFTKYLPFIEKLALDMGGIVGTLGTDKDVLTFYSKDKHTKIGVPICWESIDGNYTRKFVKNGADFLQIITNVGWWGDTDGYKQYFAISRLRAIENRRYVSICANTGFSGLVNARGEVVDKSGYWERKALKYDVPLLKNQAFFSANGDILMRPFTFFSVLLLGYSIIRNKTEKRRKIK